MTYWLNKWNKQQYHDMEKSLKLLTKYKWYERMIREANKPCDLLMPLAERVQRKKGKRHVFQYYLHRKEYKQYHVNLEVRLYWKHYIILVSPKHKSNFHSLYL